jgi:hypothetical protein
MYSAHGCPALKLLIFNFFAQGFFCCIAQSRKVMYPAA